MNAIHENLVYAPDDAIAGQLEWNAREHVLALVEWYGKRGPNDELLPADEQEPEIAHAMRFLAELEK